MAELRRCIGSAKYGIEAHDAPIGDFPVQPSQRDGLGRMCKPHWNEYTSALRKAALARKANVDEEPTVEATPPEAESEPAVKDKPATRRRRRAAEVTEAAQEPPTG